MPYNVPMAKKTMTNGKGRVVTLAPNSANGKSAKSAGVKSRAKSVRTATVRANATNAKRRVKQYATEDGFVDYLDGLSKTPVMPKSLVNDKTAKGAEARRSWCVANGISPVFIYDDGLGERRVNTRPVDKNGAPDTDLWRPEACVRERLRSLSRLGVSFGYTRAETAWVQTSTVCKLDWSKGLPDDFDGTDAVYIYRVSK